MAPWWPRVVGPLRTVDVAVAAVCAAIMLWLAAGGYLRDVYRDAGSPLLFILAFVIALAACLRALFRTEIGWPGRFAPAVVFAATVLLLAFVPGLL